MNGQDNYETNAVHQYFENDAAGYEWMIETIEDVCQEADDRDAAINQLADKMKAYVEDLVGELVDLRSYSLTAELLTGALSEVHYTYLAEVQLDPETYAACAEE